MGDWTCQECGGTGMHWSEERQAQILCTCPAGAAKKEYLLKTGEQLSQEARARARGRKKRKKEKVPF